MYRENWDNVQIEFFDPGVVGNIFYDTNGQNFLIKGLETSLVARVITGLTVQGAASWNQSQQTNSPALIDNNPASANYGKPITEVCSTGGTCTAITNPFGPVGAPERRLRRRSSSTLRARYDWPIGALQPVRAAGHDPYRAFVHAGGRQPDARRASASRPRGCGSRIPPIRPATPRSASPRTPGWSLSTARTSRTRMPAPSSATISSSSQQTPLRPRVIGVSFSYSMQ